MTNHQTSELINSSCQLIGNRGAGVQALFNQVFLSILSDTNTLNMVYVQQWYLRERFRESRITPGRISVITESCKNSVGEVPVEQENSCLSSCYISSALLCALCPVSAWPEIWSICCNFHLLPLPSQMSIVSFQTWWSGARE